MVLSFPKNLSFLTSILLILNSFWWVDLCGLRPVITTFLLVHLFLEEKIVRNNNKKEKEKFQEKIQPDERQRIRVGPLVLSLTS